MVPPPAQQTQVSSDRCCDFSWRAQSCFVEKEDPQKKVQWKGLGLLFFALVVSLFAPDSGVGLGFVVTRRRRRSRLGFVR